MKLNFPQGFRMKFKKIKSKINPFSVYIILLVIMISGFIMRYPLVHYNLPVCANVDERTSLATLFNIEKANLNPKFFHYPTFYYYLNFFILKALRIKNFLLYGRILNLLFGCILAISVFFLTKHFYRSNLSGLISAGFSIISPILIKNGSYIITDILLATLSMLALLFFAKYFEDQNYKYWLMAIIMTGLAMSTKYNAVIILISYAILEFLREKKDFSNSAKFCGILKLLNIHFPPRLIAVFFVIVALIFFSLYLFFPADLVSSILKTGGGTESVVDATDAQFIQSIRIKLLFISVLGLIIGIVFYRFKKISERFSFSRPYIAIFLTVFFFFIGSPYILIC
jgi:hypothetical protein